jgi:hypothetical protein
MLARGRASQRSAHCRTQVCSWTPWSTFTRLLCSYSELCYLTLAVHYVTCSYAQYERVASMMTERTYSTERGLTKVDIRNLMYLVRALIS